MRLSQPSQWKATILKTLNSEVLQILAEMSPPRRGLPWSFSIKYVPPLICLHQKSISPSFTAVFIICQCVLVYLLVFCMVPQLVCKPRELRGHVRSIRAHPKLSTVLEARWALRNTSWMKDGSVATCEDFFKPRVTCYCNYHFQMKITLILLFSLLTR